jgi:D-arabinose 1-dehydrogenase-like Zn-dependent alcohol dehydrogenase
VVAMGWMRMTRGKRFRLVVLKTNKDLDYMIKLFEAGKIKSIIDGPYPLEKIQDAFRLFEKGEHKGKIVIRVV